MHNTITMCIQDLLLVIYFYFWWNFCPTIDLFKHDLPVLGEADNVKAEKVRWKGLLGLPF